MEPFLGEIKLTPYQSAPSGWAFCSGQLLSIRQNTALFALLGTIYGGDGVNNFALPDLRGRAAVSHGQSPGNSPYPQGTSLGQEQVVLTVAAIPSHTHAVSVNGSVGTLASPEGNFIAGPATVIGKCYGTVASGTMPANTVGPGGANAPHENRQPFLALNYIIALQGIFPSRP